MANSRRKCALKSCGKRNRTETMVIKGLLAWCNTDHQIQYAVENNPKGRKRQEREKVKRSKARKLKVVKQDIRKQKALTQTVVNKLCLLLDKGKPCISSGVPDDGRPRRRNASHLKSRGSNSYLRYSLINLHAATAHDNNFKSGNVEGYRKGLVERYEQAMLDYLDNAPRVREWTCEELIAMRKEFAEECRRLERGENPSRDWRKLPD